MEVTWRTTWIASQRHTHSTQFITHRAIHSRKQTSINGFRPHSKVAPFQAANNLFNPPVALLVTACRHLMELLMNCLFAPLSEATTKPMQYRCADNASREEASALIQAAALALQDAMAAVREQTGSHSLSTATAAGT